MPTTTPTSASTPTPTHTNPSLYALWAPTYDSDGNILQAVDNTQLDQHLLPQLVSTIEQQQQSTQTQTQPSNPQPIHILDLGCGTGRTTLKLASLFPPSPNCPVKISAWDASAAMLSIARSKCPNAISFKQIDLLASPSSIPDECLGRYSALTSTLVLEHLPLNLYFSTIASLLAPGGVAVVTNMHPDMGAESVAGFKDENGIRLRGESFVHGVGEGVRAAEEVGLAVLGDVGEVELSEGMFEGFLREGSVREVARKWVGRRIWCGMVLRREGGRVGEVR